MKQDTWDKDMIAKSVTVHFDEYKRENDYSDHCNYLQLLQSMFYYAILHELPFEQSIPVYASCERIMKTKDCETLKTCTVIIKISFIISQHD